jgi:hypothetical protein
MPEQLTKHPQVTLQVLRSAGARCGEGQPQEILTACPSESFCKLPGGEMCVYGLDQAASMTQIGRADWQALAGSMGLAAPAPASTPASAAGADPGLVGGALLLAGVAIGWALSRLPSRWR